METATATTITITAAAIGTAETVAGKRRHFYTVQNAVAGTRNSRGWRAPRCVKNLRGRETKRAMISIITVVVTGMVETVAAPPKISITFTAPSVNVWTRKASLH